MGKETSKIEDLEAVPSTLLSVPRKQEGKNILPQVGFDRQTVPSEDLTPSSLPEPFPAAGLPEPPESLRSQMIRLSPHCLLRMVFLPWIQEFPSLPPLESDPAESGPAPFAPLPGSLPGELPELAPPGDLPPAGDPPVHCLIPGDFRPWKKVKSRKPTHFPSFPGPLREITLGHFFGNSSACP